MTGGSELGMAGDMEGITTTKGRRVNCQLKLTYLRGHGRGGYQSGAGGGGSGGGEGKMPLLDSVIVEEEEGSCEGEGEGVGEKVRFLVPMVEEGVERLVMDSEASLDEFCDFDDVQQL